MKIIFLGDSITEGGMASSPEFCYVNLVKKKLNCDVVNYGVGGTRIAPQKVTFKEWTQFDYDFIQRLKIMDRNASFVFVFGGTNDFGHGDAPLGKKSDTKPVSFYGSVNFLIKSLINIYKENKVAFILPLPRYMEDSPYGEDGTAKKVPSPTLNEYRNVIINACVDNNIPYIDLRDKFGTINTNQPSKYIVDGLHPNDLGHEVIADSIVNFLKERGIL